MQTRRGALACCVQLCTGQTWNPSPDQCVLGACPLQGQKKGQGVHLALACPGILATLAAS